MPDSLDTRYFTRFTKISAFEKTKRGILAELDTELLRVDVIRDDVVRMKISRGRAFDEEPTFAVCADPEATVPDFRVEQAEAIVRIRTARMVLTIHIDPFHIEAHRLDGSMILETAKDKEGNYWAYATLNDSFIVRRTCRPEDAFFGLGEKTGALNRKGRNFTLWNTDVLNPNASGEFTPGKAKDDPRSDNTSTEFDPYYVSIPFFYHMENSNNGAAGIFVDNGYRGHFDFSGSESYSFGFDGGQYTEYIFAGPTMRDILSGYTWLTGRMLPPPLWALGYHQCRWFPYTEDAVEQIAAQHRERDIPCDALWLDIDYMDGYRVFTWNEEAFPDPQCLLARLLEDGLRTITIIDPGIKFEPGYSIFDQAVERGMLCKTEGGDVYIGQVWPGKTAFPDFVRQEVRDWWGGLNAAHVRSGLAGIWNDMNEPATGGIPPQAMRFDGGKHSHERYHNQYALLMAMGTTDGLLEAMPDRRTFVLSRAGFAGIQRYAANWMGDNMARWDHLWLSVPMALGFGLSGQPFVGADIGGFAGNTGSELFIRWMQCGALTAFCRNHNEAGNVDQYAWSFGDEIERLAGEALRLRYRLMPYIYSAFMQSSETGEPVQRPLVFEFQGDRTLRDISDEYMFGPHLLVAPVYKPGSTARQVYFPEGTWFHWHTGERFAGKRFIAAATPMDYVPLYAKGGSVIPMWPEAPLSTSGYFPATIELHVFVPEEDGEYTSFLHEDDGLTFGFEEGSFYRTGFLLRKAGKQITLNATVTGNGFGEFARERFEIVLHGGPGRVKSDVHGTVESREAGAEGSSVQRYVEPNKGTSFEIEFELS